VKRTRAHAHVIGLKDRTTLLAPEIMEGEDHVLKAQRLLATGAVSRAVSLMAQPLA
jgi:hypothetical protein